MIVGLVSTWRDGRLAEDAVRSLLTCCQSVYVLDGSIGEPGEAFLHSETNWKDLSKTARVFHHTGAWQSDAEKRTQLLLRTRRLAVPVWGVVLDSDELLVSGEQIPALIQWHEQNAAHAEQEPFRIPLRLMDGDGTASVMTGRILRLDLVERYLISSYHLKLTNGAEVSLANGVLVPAGEPDKTTLDVTTGLQMRRPLQGEPHILHRAFLRPPQRTAERQSVAEGSAFDALVREAGLGEAHGERAQDDRSAIWLPT